jgi:NhaP-type Na+/H+ and K+/H+ antiporter
LMLCALPILLHADDQALFILLTALGLASLCMLSIGLGIILIAVTAKQGLLLPVLLPFVMITLAAIWGGIGLIHYHWQHSAWLGMLFTLVILVIFLCLLTALLIQYRQRDAVTPEGT